MLTYLTSYLSKRERTMTESMKKTAKEVTGIEVMQKLHTIGNSVLTQTRSSSHEAANKELSLHLLSSNIAIEFVPTCFKNKERET